MKYAISTISKLICLSALIIVSISGISTAQQSQVGYLGKGKDQYSVFVFGDALAGGLWAGAARISKGHPRLKLNGRYREGSGLSKPRFYNWAERLPRTLENRQIDIALVFIGTNDAQDIRRDGEYLVFNSEPWREVYTASVATMMSQLTANKTAVYWVEVPPVSRPKLDKRLKIIAAIHKTQAAKAGIRFVEIRQFFTTSGGAYSQSGAGVEGYITRLRSRNGIRFIKSGNNKLASIVLKQIDRDIAIADGEVPAKEFPVPDASNIASSEVAAYTGPIFGSAASDDQPLIIQPENMPLAGSDQSTNVLVALPTFGSENQPSTRKGNISGNRVLETLVRQVKPGSPAHSLFIDGTWPDKQSGRLDDFSSSVQ